MVADVCSPSIEKSPSTHAHSPPNPTIVALQRIFRGDLFVGMLFGVWSSSFVVLCWLLVAGWLWLLPVQGAPSVSCVRLMCVCVVVVVVCGCERARRRRAPTPPQTDRGRTRC